MMRDGLGGLGERLGWIEGGALHAVRHRKLLAHVVQVVVADWKFNKLELTNYYASIVHRSNLHRKL